MQAERGGFAVVPVVVDAHGLPRGRGRGGRGVRGGVARDDGGARCGSEVRDARAATGDAVRRVRDVQVRRGGMLGAVFGTHAAEPARLGGAGRRS